MRSLRIIGRKSINAEIRELQVQEKRESLFGLMVPTVENCAVFRVLTSQRIGIPESGFPEAEEGGCP